MRPYRSLFSIGPHRGYPRARGGIAALLALLLATLTLALGACGVTTSTLSPSARATQTAAAAGATQTAAAARATQTAQPVTVAVSATQHGMLSQRDSVLLITYTVTNHTQAPINIAGNCPMPPYTIQLFDAAGHVAYFNGPGSVPGCPIQSPYKDLTAPIPSEATGAGAYSPVPVSFWNIANGEPLIPPGTYTLVVTVNLWHQGTIEQYENDASGTYAHGSASAQTAVTLR